MNLPDVEGFIHAAEKALGSHDVVYLHDAEGKLLVALVKPEVWNHPLTYEGNHDHIEVSETEKEVLWLGSC